MLANPSPPIIYDISDAAQGSHSVFLVSEDDAIDRKASMVDPEEEVTIVAPAVSSSAEPYADVRLPQIDAGNIRWMDQITDKHCCESWRI